jgi:alpha-ketoglutarate-dependent 2,4-dichlorophenoxyacetate dioxygenase
MSETTAKGSGKSGRLFETEPVHPVFGVEIKGVTLQQAVSDAVFPAIYRAFLNHQLIVFRNVDLPPATQVALARRLGEVQIHVMNQYHGHLEHPEIYKLSNLDENGRPNGKHPDEGTLYWHTDGSWRRRRGLATMMYAEVVPSVGGQTEFADMYSAYERLSDDWKARIEGLTCVHNLDFSRTRRHGHDPMTEAQKREAPPVQHPVVRIHPETGRKAVFLGDHAECIVGMDYDVGRQLIEDLNKLITPEDLVYSHTWSPGECVIWDNRCLLHRATGFDTANEIRVMRRCTTLGETPQDTAAAA